MHIRDTFGSHRCHLSLAHADQYRAIFNMLKLSADAVLLLPSVSRFMAKYGAIQIMLRDGSFGEIESVILVLSCPTGPYLILRWVA